MLLSPLAALTLPDMQNSCLCIIFVYIYSIICASHSILRLSAPHKLRSAAVLDQSLDIVSKERDGVGARMGLENKASQSLDAFYSDEVCIMSSIRSMLHVNLSRVFAFVHTFSNGIV